MTTKLNLSIEEDIVQKVKKYAQNHNLSLSALTESYYKSLVMPQKKKKQSFVEKYAGIIKDKNFEGLDSIKDAYLKKKYDL
jgi:CO dehydrogenase/acetyl-CoA synthase epsilon subunit